MDKTATKTDAPKQVEQATEITTDELVALLMLERGANIISFVHTSNMSDKGKMVKKHRETGALNPYEGDCFKDQRARGMINFWYEKGVQTRLEKEGKSPDDFKSAGAWHEPIIRGDGTLTPFCRHKKDPRKIYIRFMLQDSDQVEYHTAKGQKIDYEAIKPFLKKRTDYANQGLEKPLIFQVWKIDGVQNISLNGKKYKIVN